MIELFKQPNIDWMGKAKYFFALSGLLLAIGWLAIFLKGGIKYGIDFRGGTDVTVRFAQPPNIDKLRSSLRDQGLGNTEIQTISDISSPNSSDAMIFVEQTGQGDQASDEGKRKVVAALNAEYGVSSSNKPDFNSVMNPTTLANFLAEKDPLGLSISAGDKYQQMAKTLLAFRDRDRNGILKNFDDLGQVVGVTPAVISALNEQYTLAPFAIRDVAIVGPKVGAELRLQAIRVTLYALAGMLVYIAFRFYGGQIGGTTGWAAKGIVGFAFRFMDRIIFGLAAVLAVFHDVLITLGLFKIFGFEISLTVIAALLTLVGYSMNDTIVIFDRIRENNRLLRKEAFADVVNKSINQTLSRTILTSGLTFLTVLVLFLMGGQVLRAFAFALVVGIVVGTYSSFGIAAPLVVAWNRWRGHGAAVGSGTAAGTKTRGGSEGGQPRLATAGRR
jgi:preprotein translocase subunit SecF